MKTVSILLLCSLTAVANAGSFSALFSPTAPESAKTEAMAAHASGKIVPREDVVDGSVTVGRPDFDPLFSRLPGGSNDGKQLEAGGRARISLSIVKLKGEKPTLFLRFDYYGAGWLFIKSADFKIGTNHVELVCDKPRHDVIHGEIIYEGESWPVNGNAKAQAIVKAVAYGNCSLCALRGSEGTYGTTAKKENFEPILSAYFALGGEPLRLEYRP
jgi:hypothetical protein